MSANGDLQATLAQLLALQGAAQRGGALPQQQPPQQPQSPENQMREVLDQILGGEMPGAGYLWASDPEKRQRTLVKTDPENARAALLRAVEACAQAAMLPFGATPRGELAKAALAFSQSYLLLDPSVDEAGVPVGAQAHAQGEAQEGVAAAQGEAQAQTAERSAQAQAHFQPKLPPRVQPNPAEKKIQEKHEGQEKQLRGDRGQVPRPRPRVGE